MIQASDFPTCGESSDEVVPELNEGVVQPVCICTGKNFQSFADGTRARIYLK